MTRAEQQRLVDDIRRCLSKMDNREKDDASLMIQRSIDDEDFDSLTRKRLLELHAKYCKKKSRAEIEEKWKRLTGKS
jgi:hypothetical protein